MGEEDSHVETDFPPNLGRPARDALIVAGFTRLEQLTQVTEKDLLKLHGMGPKGIRQLREGLAERGWDFRASH